MKSVEELKKMRDEAKKMTRLRERGERMKIIVSMGTCGIAAGARAVMVSLVDEVAKRGLDDVVITQTGCIGLCDKEPIIIVESSDGERMTYGDITEENARRIVVEHVINGRPIGQLIIARD